MKVLGRRIDLDGGRLVFFGQSEEAPGVRFLGFRNKEGKDLRFQLSEEAFDALRRMIANPMYGMPLQEFPFKFEWTLVKPEHDQT